MKPGQLTRMNALRASTKALKADKEKAEKERDELKAEKKTK